MNIPRWRFLPFVAAAGAHALETCGRARVEWLFLALGVFFGTCAALLHGPANGADENSHFFRAFALTEGMVFPAKTGEGMDDCTAPIPRCLVDLVYNRLWNSPYNRHPLSVQAARALVSERCAMLREPYLDQPRLEASLGNAAGFGAVCYLPQALGLLAGRWSGASPLGLIYWGRFFNLLAYLAIAAAAIRLTPVGKWLIFIVAMTPMALLQAGSLSADATTNALAWLLAALLFRIAFTSGSRLGLGGLGVLCFAETTLTFCKPGYFFLSLLIFLSPLSVFGSRRRQLLFLSVYFAVVLAGILLMAYLVNRAFLQPPGNDKNAQLLFVVTHPFHYLRTLVLTVGVSLLKSHPSLPVALVGSVGANPYFQVPSSFAAFYLFAYGWAAWMEAPALSLRAKGTLLAITALAALQIYTMLYLYWTPVAHITVYGVHGRVFLPLLPVILAAMGGGGACMRWRGVSPAFLTAAAATGGIVLVGTLLHVFWLPSENLLRQDMAGEQVFQSAREDGPAFSDYGVVVRVRPHTRYLLYIHASTTGTVTPAFYCFAAGENDGTGPAKPLDDDPVLTLRPNRAQQHKFGTFSTGAETEIRIVAYPAHARPGDRAIWHAWALTRN